MKRRVVISGMGVVAPNGSNLDSFTQSIREGKSGIRKIPELEEKGFRCQVGGVPRLEQEQIEYLAILRC
jgi:3-oxoacyl-(acyl-carrier-protein) synthase